MNKVAEKFDVKEEERIMNKEKSNQRRSESNFYGFRLFDFSPTSTGVPVNLPTYDPLTHNFTYSMSVVPGVEVFIDPQIAEGYDYRIGAGNPNFQSVELPQGIGDSLYDLYLFDSEGNLVLLQHDLAGGTVFDFGPGGLDAFRVLGIELSAMVDPTDITAFVTGLTFTGAGDFTGTQTPLVVDVSAVPEPPGLLLLMIGIAALVAARGGMSARNRIRRFGDGAPECDLQHC